MPIKWSQIKERFHIIYVPTDVIGKPNHGEIETNDVFEELCKPKNWITLPDDYIYKEHLKKRNALTIKNNNRNVDIKYEESYFINQKKNEDFDFQQARFDSQKPYLFVSLEKPESKKNRRLNFFNSSIWNYSIHFIPELEKKSIELMNIQKWKSYFNSQLEEINREYEKHKSKFSLVTALENREFSLRRFKNSYLIHQDSNLEDLGHGMHVEPFHFHSENYFRTQCLTILNSIDIMCPNVTFDITIAVCDDHSINPLSGTDKEYPMTKTDIIKELIKSSLEEFEKDILNLKYKTYSTVDKLLTDKNNNCEIILIDYLFSKDENGNSLEFPKYGIELFEFSKRENNNKNNTHRFLGKRWVIPISAFSDSMIDDLRKNGITFTDGEIVLSRGADPITTPYLFLHELFYMIKEQIDMVFKWNIDFSKNYVKEKVVKVLNDLNTIDDVKKSKDDWLEYFIEASSILKMEYEIESLSKSQNETDSHNNKLACSIRKIMISNSEIKNNINIVRIFNHLLYQLCFRSTQNNNYIVTYTSDLLSAILEYRDDTTSKY